MPLASRCSAYLLRHAAARMKPLGKEVGSSGVTTRLQTAGCQAGWPNMNSCPPTASSSVSHCRPNRAKLGVAPSPPCRSSQTSSSLSSTPPPSLSSSSQNNKRISSVSTLPRSVNFCPSLTAKPWETLSRHWSPAIIADESSTPPRAPPRRKRLSAVEKADSSFTRTSSSSNHPPADMPVWGYGKSTGPHTWAVHYPLASGQRQSPIDIPSGRGEVVNLPSSLTWSYDADACDRITNTGTGWKLLVSGSGELSGGPLPSKFKLEQIHAHWGRVEDEGSEHTVDGVAYPGEIHLVHWDCEKYSSFGEAANADGGLAVLGVFMQVGGEGHSEIQKIVDALCLIPNKGLTENLPTNVDPVKLLPESKAFWNYEGSLTTPPCLETVNWIVFKSPISVSKEQIAAFRALRAYGPEDEEPGVDEFNGQVVMNFRPPMPLCGRVVRDCC